MMRFQNLIVTAAVALPLASGGLHAQSPRAARAAWRPAVQFSPDTAEDNAKRAAAAWLALGDSARYAASWDSASVALRKAVTRDQWVAGITQVRTSAGTFGARTVSQYQFATSLPGAPPGDYVVLQYHTVAGTGFVTETVALTRDGSRGWRVAGYFVKPG
ncbi:MAG: DUF4019 domain-containing protein [Gemmatimonadota bacterium]|nr:DUF4019 domain-containing protein [Gemmatimonadota bacterium]